ncbi:uncharacterized protein GGS22DRAFT_192907 [Annulohypoxylon maeteangense]|uniref:uncharacterized protein n=1 Tax=Annulohypoxylon maeteangense TaxID=1927788 RepID=UPI002007E2D3|nr:uncharacterized protein GGS22DRAFT_192907 [Annulohypoxylon maeteangense]KAI0880771.1 hypothetical protein GGS22DRAFT_192907 [Annulohypoxylon maeteangense]
MKSWISGLSLAALLPFAAADCDKFDFTGQYGSDGFTTTYNKTLRVSGFTNCTAEIAGQDTRNGTCLLSNPGIGIGLEVYPEVRFIQVDAKAQREVLALVQEKMSAVAAATTNFNSTIVMNYTSILRSTAVGNTGYGGFTPYIRCFDGVLSDCDKDDNLEGKAIRACGLTWLDRNQGFKSLGSQAYDGEENFVSYSDGNGTENMGALPLYDSVSGHATNYQGDDEDDHGNSATKTAVGSAALVVALLSAVYEIM